MKHHLAILTPGWIELILDGKKTIESRFSKVRCAPFGKVQEGDIVFMKESGGLVKGMFTVVKVDTIENLTYELRIMVHSVFGEQIFGTLYYDGHYDKWKASKHATLIHIGEIRGHGSSTTTSATSRKPLLMRISACLLRIYSRLDRRF